MPPQSSLSILAILEDFADKHREENFTVRDLSAHMGDHGLLILLMIFALFCAVPLPIPGIHIFLSMPLFYVTIQQVMGRHRIWFPETVLNYTLPRDGFIAMIERSRPWFIWLGHYIKPRLSDFTQEIWYQIMGGICLFITTIIVIPLPLTNVIPAISIVIITLGMMCKDGLTTLIGAILGILWCLAWLALAAFIGIAGMAAIYSILFS